MRVNTKTLPVGLIVLTWNGRQWLDACLSSILELNPAPADVVVVDNASTDGTAELVRRNFPGVTFVTLDRNLGFAAGNNAGARVTQGEFLAFLNNDTIVDRLWLGRLFDAMSADPAIGLSTSHIVFLDQPDVIDSAGDGYLRCGGAYKRAHGQRDSPGRGVEEVFGACGAGFLIRRQLFDALGGFDEDFFMVYEDVDLSYRARLAGARCVYVPEAVVRHAGSGTIGRVSASQVFYGQRNLEWTWIKNSPAGLLWRSAVPHAFFDLAGAVAYARQGHLGTWVRAKVASVAGLPAVWRKRRQVQRTRSVDADTLWRLMEPDWVGVKRAEKAFDFSRGSGTRQPSLGSLE